jgi:hypothetical protein
MNADENSTPVGFGLPSEWQTFIGSNPVLVSKLQLLFKTLERILYMKDALSRYGILCTLLTRSGFVGQFR